MRRREGGGKSTWKISFTCAVAHLEAFSRAAQLAEQLLSDAVRVMQQMYSGERRGRLLLRCVSLPRRPNRPL